MNNRQYVMKHYEQTLEYLRKRYESYKVGSFAYDNFKQKYDEVHKKYIEFLRNIWENLEDGLPQHIDERYYDDSYLDEVYKIAESLKQAVKQRDIDLNNDGK